jgi:hypothetical protein
MIDGDDIKQRHEVADGTRGLIGAHELASHVVEVRQRCRDQATLHFTGGDLRQKSLRAVSNG